MKKWIKLVNIGGSIYLSEVTLSDKLRLVMTAFSLCLTSRSNEENNTAENNSRYDTPLFLLINIDSPKDINVIADANVLIVTKLI